MSDIVFVYGSLMRGGRFHGALSRAVFLGEARTCEPYLLHLGWDWPLLIERPPAAFRAPICGECYAVDRLTLRRLDEIEDNGRLYQRKRACVRIGEDTLSAWIYFANSPKLIKMALRRPKTAFSPQKGCQFFEVKK